MQLCKKFSTKIESFKAARIHNAWPHGEGIRPQVWADAGQVMMPRHHLVTTSFLA